ncbi:MAG TPA: leucyl aminopeptidase [Bacteroidota bacterium]
MKLSFQASSPQKSKADILAVFLYSGDASIKTGRKFLSEQFGEAATLPLDSGDFKSAIGDIVHLYLQAKTGPARLLLVGLGEQKKAVLETYRRAAARAARRCRDLKAVTAGMFVPQGSEDIQDVIMAMGEGALLGVYRFDKYITRKPEDRSPLQEIILISDAKAAAEKGRRAVEQAGAIAEATMMSRDLCNAPGNEIYPETLAKAAADAGKQYGFKVTVLGKAEIEKHGMGGVLGVSQGSTRQPRFIIMEYGKKKKNTVVLVGKGVTFDTGGISIKPSANMAEMKMDMSGAAAVIGTMRAAASLKLPVHVIGLVPAVENMPGGNSIRPGDILRHYNGKTSEVDNTDAEGRLILADALGFAGQYKPAAVIDLATLTGACVVALGHVVTGMMGTDAQLMSKLKKAGEQTYERVWELPLFDEYEKLIKSDVADVKNVGGRWAGAITAGWFLRKFIGDYSWAHLDIAGTAMLEENGDYTQRGASGVGVRLLTEFLRNWK